jgi:hypothetical protein
MPKIRERKGYLSVIVCIIVVISMLGIFGIDSFQKSTINKKGSVGYNDTLYNATVEESGDGMIVRKTATWSSYKGVTEEEDGDKYLEIKYEIDANNATDSVVNFGVNSIAVGEDVATLPFKTGVNETEEGKQIGDRIYRWQCHANAVFGRGARAMGRYSQAQNLNTIACFCQTVVGISNRVCESLYGDNP